MKPVIIGLLGQANSGKDTCADLLVQEMGFVKISLADPLKRICKDVFNFSHDQLWGPSHKRNEPDQRYPRPRGVEDMPFLTPRLALQLLGTEWGRYCYPNVWIDYALRKAQKLLAEENSGDDPMGVVISDCRFFNEVRAIKEAGGVVLRIVRQGSDPKLGIAHHMSEEEQKTIPDSVLDGVILNQPGLEEYHKAIRSIVIPILSRRRDDAP